MTKELIEWFNNYFYNCYYVKHDDYPESIFMFYDKNYIRKQKLAKIEGKNIEKTDITGVCLFEQDWKNKYFRCNYILIYSYLRDNYSFSYDDFQSFMMDRLVSMEQVLEEYTKMNILTPLTASRWRNSMLEEYTKMKVLTPTSSYYSLSGRLEEHSKMKVLTPTLSF